MVLTVPEATTLHNQHPVCILDDDVRIRESMQALVRSAGHPVETFPSALAFLDHEREIRSEPSCLILDVNLPGLDGYQLQKKLQEEEKKVPIIFVTGHGDIPSSVRAIKAGAMEYFTKPFDPETLLEAVGRAVQQSAFWSAGRPRPHTSNLGIIGDSPSLRRILQEVEIVASTDVTVLIHGETGTGKELIARALHLKSGRPGAFIKMNCAAVPANLLESELMGHEKGSFTGAASRRIGRFEAAEDGTIFLDEIGELPLDLQPKILRLIQEREFERLGSNKTIRSNARLVAATNRDLGAMVAEHQFREDLFYRLNVFPIGLPPLREHREDVPELAQHFANAFTFRTGRYLEAIPAEFINRLCAHDWPGNIRELMNVVERAAILATHGVLPLSALVGLGASPALPRSRVEAAPSPRSTSTPARGAILGNASSERLEDIERHHILGVLEATNWVVGGPRGAAARLGMKRPTLIFRMKKLGIERSSREES
jgi:DNA-binding NtrC family response regulator